MLMNYKYYIDEPINLNKPNQNSDYFNINSHGFRGQEVNSEKQDDTFRIFFVGGSTAFGYVTMSDDSTISGSMSGQSAVTLTITELCIFLAHW